MELAGRAWCGQERPVELAGRAWCGQERPVELAGRRVDGQERQVELRGPPIFKRVRPGGDMKLDTFGLRPRWKIYIACAFSAVLGSVL